MKLLRVRQTPVAGADGAGVGAGFNSTLSNLIFVPPAELLEARAS